MNKENMANHISEKSLAFLFAGMLGEIYELHGCEVKVFFSYCHIYFPPDSAICLLSAVVLLFLEQYLNKHD